MKNDESLEEIKKRPSSSEEDGRVYETPDIARVSFTELKISESRKHAYEYGRLGIGVKRMFLFHRAGHPMIYISPFKEYQGKNWFSNYIEDNTQDIKFQAQKSYFKYMSEKEDLNYKYYAESEWRIVCPNNINEYDRIHDSKKSIDIKNYFIDVNNNNYDEEHKKYQIINEIKYKYTKFKYKCKDEKLINVHNKEFKNFIEKNRGKGLKFLVPLDFWLAIIIYPSLAVKTAAESDPEIRELIRDTRINIFNEELLEVVENKIRILQRDNYLDKIYYLLSEIQDENYIGDKYIMPTEIDLDTMSHF
jgi:hypothetical protein